MTALTINQGSKVQKSSAVLQAHWVYKFVAPPFNDAHHPADKVFGARNAPATVNAPTLYPMSPRVAAIVKYALTPPDPIEAATSDLEPDDAPAISTSRLVTVTPIKFVTPTVTRCRRHGHLLTRHIPRVTMRKSRRVTMKELQRVITRNSRRVTMKKPQRIMMRKPQSVMRWHRLTFLHPQTSLYCARNIHLDIPFLLFWQLPLLANARSTMLFPPANALEFLTAGWLTASVLLFP